MFQVFHCYFLLNKTPIIQPYPDKQDISSNFHKNYQFCHQLIIFKISQKFLPENCIIKTRLLGKSQNFIIKWKNRSGTLCFPNLTCIKRQRRAFTGPGNTSYQLSVQQPKKFPGKESIIQKIALLNTIFEVIFKPCLESFFHIFENTIFLKNCLYCV